MNQLVSLDHEVIQLLLLLVEVIGIRIHTESNGQRCFRDGLRGLRVGRLSKESLMQFAYHGAHGFRANAFGLFLVVGLELIERGLESTEKHEELQLGFEALKMEDIAPQAGKCQSPE